MRIHLFLLMVFLSCKDKNEDIIVPPAGNKLSLDWKVSLADDNHFTLTSISPVILAKEVAFFYDATTQEKILFVEKGGLIHLRKTDLFSGNAKFACSNGNGGMLTNDYKKLYSISSSTDIRQLCNSPSTNQFNVRSNLIGEYLYMYTIDHSNNSGAIYKVNSSSGSISLDKKVEPSQYPGSISTVVYTPTFYVSESKDTILNYSHLIIYTADSGKVFSNIIDKKSGNLLWEDNDGKTFELQSCIAQENNSIITFGNKLNSFNCLNGDALWDFKIPVEWGYYGGPNSILKVGSIVYLIINGRLVGVNILSGIIEYQSPKILVATSESKLTFFDGVLYFTALDNENHSCIFGIRESDGKEVVHMRSPNSGIEPYNFDTNFRYSGLVIDPTTRKGYTSDGFFAMCFSIPENYE